MRITLDRTGVAALASRTLLLLLMAASTVLAQSQSRLTGTVTDNSGAVIPGAPITITNVDTGVSQTVGTNENGDFVIPYINPGNYEVSVEYSGFKTFNQSGITIETGATRTLQIEMQVGDVTEVVTVEADVPLLESESSSVGQFIERETVFNMPLQSRRSASLVRLMGNISYRSEDGGEQVPKFSMAGGRSQNQMWTLDGSVVQNMSIGTQQLAMNPPAESLQEFKAEASNYAAEYGRAGGGFIIMTTRSGTNEFHGALYEFFRNDAMDARSFFAADKAPLRYNIFGGSLGGPIVKNKTFFFFNYEGSRRRDGVTYSGDDVPHIPERNGDFSARTNFDLGDPLGGSGAVFPNNIIPQARNGPSRTANRGSLSGPEHLSAVDARSGEQLRQQCLQRFGTGLLDWQGRPRTGRQQSDQHALHLVAGAADDPGSLPARLLRSPRRHSRQPPLEYDDELDSQLFSVVYQRVPFQLGRSAPHQPLRRPQLREER